MQLLVLILKKVDLMDEILKQLLEKGVKGGTIMEGTGMAKALSEIDDLPMFGMLRRLLDSNDLESSKVMMFVLKADKAVETRETIKSVIDLSVPNTGIMFAVPITYVEGLGE